MNRLDRLMAIQLQLQSKKFISVRELSYKFEISVRTIYRDIHSLEEAGIPLSFEPGKGYFIMQGFHLPPVMFTENEASAMLLAEKLVSRF